MSQSCNRVFHGVVDDVLDLQFVWMVRVCIREATELLGQLEAMSNSFRRDKVFSHLDAAMQVAYLNKWQIKRLLKLEKKNPQENVTW